MLLPLPPSTDAIHVCHLHPCNPCGALYLCFCLCLLPTPSLLISVHGLMMYPDSMFLHAVCGCRPPPTLNMLAMVQSMPPPLFPPKPPSCLFVCLSLCLSSPFQGSSLLVVPLDLAV